jgi:hypothetical protein
MSKSLKTPPASTSPTPAERRLQKQEAALKMNLKKRKDQARERDSTAEKGVSESSPKA